MKRHLRALLLTSATTLLGAAALTGCDTLFIMGDDPYWLAQECEDGTTDCFAQFDCVPSPKNNHLDDSCGTFVSPDGSDADGTPGTKDAPFLTLEHAMSETTTGRVYACANAAKPFDEAVSPTVDVTVFGGLDCANGWFYDGTKKSAWTAPADTVPLALTAAAKVEVYDFAVTARDADKLGGSSIAVLAAGATAELHLERCYLVAKNGRDGVTPEKPPGTGTPGEGGEDGANGCVDGTSKIGGDPGKNTCEAMSHDGGVGGIGTTSNGGPGGDGQPTNATGKGGKAQTIAGDTCTPGDIGENGAGGEPGLGASGVGAISSNGYSGVSGDPGKGPGTPGQGGGGGGGAKICVTMGYAGPGGGGGGAGGCGGLPGSGGGPGGASISLVSAGATVSLADVKIAASMGGKGGTGGDGQLGGLGGIAGQAGTNKGDGAAKACGGGDGGKGGDGGPGGGGQGGPSIGIAFTGAAPIQNNVTVDPGDGGNGGPGGDMTMDWSAKGANGLFCKTLDFEQGAVGCVQ